MDGVEPSWEPSLLSKSPARMIMRLALEDLAGGQRLTNLGLKLRHSCLCSRVFTRSGIVRAVGLCRSSGRMGLECKTVGFDTSRARRLRVAFLYVM